MKRKDYIRTLIKGNYYKIFTMDVNGLKYYFIARIDDIGFIWSYTDYEKANNMFTAAEKYIEKYYADYRKSREEVETP